MSNSSQDKVIIVSTKDRFPTASAIEEAAKVDEGWVARTYNKTVEAEERVIMLQQLIDKGVGLAEVEEFFEDLAQKCRNSENRSRKENLIMLTMKDKHRDALKDRDYWRLQKAKTIKKVLTVLGEGSTEARSILDRARASANEIRVTLQDKYRDKVRNLYRKYKEVHDRFTLPEELNRYTSVKCFQSNYQPSEAPAVTEPLVLGGMTLDEDEREAMRLDPKFAVLNRLTEEDFELEVQCCLTKLRWDKMAEDRLDEDVTEEEREKTEILEAEERQIFDPKTKTVDYCKYRATDAPMNATLHLPPGQTPEYEAGLEVRFQKWMGTVSST